MKRMIQERMIPPFAGVALALWSGGALAHSPAPDGANAFAAGLLHPLTGADHLAAIVCCGLLAARFGANGGIGWRIGAPLGFALFMIAGALLGAHGWAPPWNETAILITLALLGLALAADSRWRAPVCALAAFAALAHGAAHGAESPAGGLAPFIAGMAATSALAGMATAFVGGALFSRWRPAPLATGGAVLAVAAFLGLS